MMLKKTFVILFINMSCFITNTFADNAPGFWPSIKFDREISENVLYLPISDDAVKAVKLKAVDEKFVDLQDKANPRIQPLSKFDLKYSNACKGNSKVRFKVYKKLLKMLDLLPPDIGIAYFEGLRPISKQKEYFDKKFKEVLSQVKVKELAYQETTKHISPFINNIPTHCTGAAIDITLFSVSGNGEELLDMGKFGTIFGHNDQQETFSPNTSQKQRDNRLMLLHAAIKSGFVNYGYEWWHYSYGDKAWAYVKKRKVAIYGVFDKNHPIFLIDKESYFDSIKN